MIDTFMMYFLVVPIILLIVTVALIINGKKKMGKYNECIGTIVGFHENTSELRLDSYESKAISPVVSYSVNGRMYEFTGNYYSTSMKEGQEIKVLYNKEDHSRATIKTGIYFAPIITGSLTVFSIMVIIIYLVL